MDLSSIRIASCGTPEDESYDAVDCREWLMLDLVAHMTPQASLSQDLRARAATSSWSLSIAFHQ